MQAFLQAGGQQWVVAHSENAITQRSYFITISFIYHSTCYAEWLILVAMMEWASEQKEW